MGDVLISVKKRLNTVTKQTLLMKKPIVVIIFSLCLVLSGCGKNDPSVIFPLERAESVTDLSGAVADIQLLSLEEVPGSLLTYPTKMLILPDGSLIFKDSGGKIMKFGADGSYQGRIGARGRGPGEYNKVQDICSEPVTGNVCVMDMGHILRYRSSDGSFIDGFSIPQHNYDEFCPDGKGGYWLFAAAPDYDSYDFSVNHNTLSHFPAGSTEPSETRVSRKDYIMNTSLISQSCDGAYWLRPLEGENVLYKITSSVTPTARLDFGEKGVPLHYMINNGMPDFARYMPSPYYKNTLYVHDTESNLFFTVIGPAASSQHFLFDKSFEKGLTWKDNRDSDTPSIIMASDKQFFYVMVFTAQSLLNLNPEQLSPLNREILKAVKETDFPLNSNPLIAKVVFNI